MKILLATTNAGKIKEIRAAYKDTMFDVVTLADIDFDKDAPAETGATFYDNAMLKAKYYAEETGYVTLADDSGLCIDALDQWPGVYSARVGNTDQERQQAVLEKMKDLSGKEQRAAAFAIALAVYDPRTSTSYVVEEREAGYIIDASAYKDEDTSAMTYDPIFFSPTFNKTYDQLTVDEKNQVSHRGKALTKIEYVLKHQYKPNIFMVPLGLVIRDGKILLAERNDPHRPEFHRKWEFPGGGIDFGETIEETVIREVKEEVGLEVEVVQMSPRIFSDVQEAKDKSWKYQAMLVPFVCKVTGGKEEPSDKEILSLSWVELDAAHDFDMVGANNSIYKELVPFLKQMVEDHNL